ncbi:protein phosphatase type 2A regulator [Dioszegia hungarica]|uniref:Serine/threonine-protein phosphatase 2A activator n=1 Tax=Dioszegia hungarica TaxID=4972 RepID=A0AA38H861_9TREE|nr:protein phosphatase type 2A regulator [Dioszegia hungarica]KAI9635752.1 protein phosphatase type 2A regulator [Dioszegia hungarica]
MASTSGFYLPTSPAAPAQVLNTDEAVAEWLASPGFRAFWGWIQRRCERIRGKEIRSGSTEGCTPAIQHLMLILDSLMSWVEEVPTQPQSSQRFGNLAFRSYIKLVEERLPALLQSVDLPPYLANQILPLLIQSSAFGHATRLDYGTGHELAFVLALWCCVASGWVGSGEGGEDEEDELILRVFAHYLNLTTVLQMQYRLEPAGSHGVWGLDDYCFFPYLFGSAQLLGSDLTPPRSLALAQASTPSVVPTLIPLSPSTPLTDMFTLSLYRLTLFKSGAAFSEHSPLLYSLCQMPNWYKPHSGLRKMFLGEVVGKKVVVQGLWIGGWLWGEDVPVDKSSGGENKEGEEKRVQGEGQAATGAPWAAVGRVDGRRGVLESTRSTWSSPTIPRR